MRKTCLGDESASVGQEVSEDQGLHGAAPPLPTIDLVGRGMVLVSEDRKRYGLVLEQSIGFNLSLSSLEKVDAVAPFGHVNRLLDGSYTGRNHDDDTARIPAGPSI